MTIDEAAVFATISGCVPKGNGSCGEELYVVPSRGSTSKLRLVYRSRSPAQQKIRPGIIGLSIFSLHHMHGHTLSDPITTGMTKLCHMAPLK